MKPFRSPRKFERARPLKLTIENGKNVQSSSDNNNLDEALQSELEEFKRALENLSNFPSNSSIDENAELLVGKLYQKVKTHGSELDSKYLDSMDECFDAIRLVIRKNALSSLSVMKLVELIEWRATGWRDNAKMVQFYENLGTQNGVGHTYYDNVNHNTFLSSSPTDMNSPGKFSKAAKVTAGGKNTYKDEIVIKNSDSGKVASGAKDRLIQITGSNGESIGNAKMLIEDTIRRNSSPVGERYNLDYPNQALSPEEDDNHLYNGNREIQNFWPIQIPISGYDENKGKFCLCGDSDSVEIINEVKEVLDNYFKNKTMALTNAHHDHKNFAINMNGCGDGKPVNAFKKKQVTFEEQNKEYASNNMAINLPQAPKSNQRIFYSRTTLLELFNSAYSHKKIGAIVEIQKKFPALIRGEPAKTLPKLL